MVLKLGEPMRRREFIWGLGGAAAWPLAARAQQPSIPVVGFLRSTDCLWFCAFRNRFPQGPERNRLSRRRNVTVEFRWAEDQSDKLSALAADLINRQVALIVANTPSALVAKAATTTVADCLRDRKRSGQGRPRH